MRADAVAASGLESDTSKTRICEAKKDLERGTNSVESNLVAIGFRFIDSRICTRILAHWIAQTLGFPSVSNIATLASLE